MARYNEFLSLTFACAAGTYFRYTTKVGKDVPKKGKTTVRSCFLSSLWNPFYLSTARASPPRINAQGLTDTITQRGSRAVGAVEIETSTSRELPRRNRKHKRLWREPWTCYRALPGVAGTSLRNRCCAVPRNRCAERICEKTDSRICLRTLPGRNLATGGSPDGRCPFEVTPPDIPA